MAFGIQKLVELLKQEFPDRNEIYFWADGGLRSWGTLEQLLHLSSSLNMDAVSAHFFASYHGHNPCDAHFGQIKTLAKNLGKQGMLSPHDIEQIIRGLPRTTLHLIPSTTPPLVPSLFVKTLTLSHYQSFYLVKDASRPFLNCFPTDFVCGDQVETFAADLQSPTTPQVTSRSTAMASPDEYHEDEDDNFDEAYDFDDDDENDDIEDSHIEDEDIEAMLGQAESSDSTFISTTPSIAPRARCKRAQLESSEILRLASLLSTHKDVQYYLATNIADQDVVNALVDLWKTLCGAKGKTRDTKSFVSKATALLDDVVRAPFYVL